MASCHRHLFNVAQRPPPQLPLCQEPGEAPALPDKEHWTDDGPDQGLGLPPRSCAGARDREDGDHCATAYQRPFPRPSCRSQIRRAAPGMSATCSGQPPPPSRGGKSTGCTLTGTRWLRMALRSCPGTSVGLVQGAEPLQQNEPPICSGKTPHRQRQSAPPESDQAG